MLLTLSDTTINTYFGFLTKLDTASKKRMIIKLTESIDTQDTGKSNSAQLFGAWDDEKSSDEIIAEIRESRTEKNNLIEL